MSDMSTCIDEVIRMGLAPLTKKEGFTKSGRSFHRQSGNNWLVVNVQASQGNTRTHGKFTINLGVYLAAVSLLVSGSLRGRPKEYQCTVRERIGSLMPGEQDHWWVVDPSTTNPQTVALEVATVIQNAGLPWLNRHTDLAHVAERLRIQPSIMSAAAALATGDRTEAKWRIERMVRERPMAAATARAWGKAHGLDDDVA